MPPERAAQRAIAAIERRPAPATAQRSAAPATQSAARALHQRLGNSATQALIARSIATPSKKAGTDSPLPDNNTAPQSVQLAQA